MIGGKADGIDVVRGIMGRLLKSLVPSSLCWRFTILGHGSRIIETLVLTPLAIVGRINGCGLRLRLRLTFCYGDREKL